MKKPWIGMPMRYQEKTEYHGQIRHYLEAILWAGGIPLMIPLIGDAETLREYVRRADGFLLPGSPTDIDPVRYGAPAHPKLGKLYPQRDVTDFGILEEAEKNEKPVLGICFGAQSLNVFRGGSLIQDIASVVPNALAHDEDSSSDSPPNPARHWIRIGENSLVAKFARKREADVNSYHHQAVESPGLNLRVVAHSADGVAEAVEDTRGRFIVGVQWHPEREFRTDPLAQGLFKALVEAAAL